MHSAWLATSALLVGTLVSSPLVAQDKKPPPTEFTSDLGLVSVSGNTSVTTMSANERLIRRVWRWEFKQDFGLVYGKTDGKESSNLWRAGLRGDYGLGDHLAVYARTTFDRNKFAGIKSRFGEGVGLVLKALATDREQLGFEAGFELTQQKDLDGSSDSFLSLRGASSYKHSFSKSSFFLQNVEVLPNLDEAKDLRVNSETALVAPLSTHTAMKFSYVVRFDNLPALNAAGTAPLRKSDRIFSAGLQFSF